MKKKIALLSVVILLMSISVEAKTKVIAHRGYWKTEGSAQNSIRSLVKADSIKSYGSEFDVWLTPDKNLVVNHDGKINGYVIEDTNSDIILQQKLANGECVPTLDHFLDVAKKLKTKLVLELKPHKNQANENEAVPMILDMIKRKGLEKRMIYITFSRNAFDNFVEQTKQPVQFLTGITPQQLKAAGGAGADYHINVFKKNPGWIKELHDMGLKVNVWTVNEPADIQWCIDNGADFITTNEPELVQKMLKQ